MTYAGGMNASAQVLASSCPLDCPDSCSLDVRVEDGRVTKLDGNHRNPVTAGYICAKVRNFPKHVYGGERLLYPAIRRGPKGAGQFERIGWEEAYSLLAERTMATVAESGGESVLPFYYGGSNGLLSNEMVDARFFRRLGSSRLARTVCAAATAAAAAGLYGKMGGVAYEDFPEARLIVVWGANPSASGIHLIPYIQEALERGAKLVVVDPRRTQLAKKAHIHLALKPGTDLPLALAMIHWLFANGHADLDFLAAHAEGASDIQERAAAWTLETAAAECGLDAADVEAFARLYAETSPALIRVGWGQERNRNGGSATAAVLALPAIAGKFGVRGGGYTASNSGAWGFDVAPLINAPPPATRLVNMNRLGRTLLDASPAVRLLFVYNANPLATLPEQNLVRDGLLREDLFTVVFEQVMTDTARYADLLLPATTFLEHADFRRGYGAYAVQPVRPVIAPVGEAKSNVDVFAELIRRCGLRQDGDRETPEELEAALLAQNGLTEDGRRAFREEGLAEPPTGRRPIQFVDLFPNTPDRKVQLFPASMAAEALGGLYVYKPDPTTVNEPLTLISPATSKTISSTLGQLLGEARVDVHPLDASSRGIGEGDEVRLANTLGEVICRAHLTRDVRPGVLVLTKGLWLHQTRNRATSNALCPDTCTDLGEGATFNDARVQLERWTPSPE
jgi:anaerobic selenocysteine-containing dehydrogenase